MDYFFGFLIGALVGLVVSIGLNLMYVAWRVRQVLNNAEDKATGYVASLVKKGITKGISTYEARNAKLNSIK